MKMNDITFYSSSTYYFPDPFIYLFFVLFFFLLNRDLAEEEEFFIFSGLLLYCASFFFELLCVFTRECYNPSQRHCVQLTFSTLTRVQPHSVASLLIFSII